MAEKGQTSSMTSVTEEDISAGSESDTTESSYSNLTSSLLSSTDTDDKLTPSLIKISISNTSAASRPSNHRKLQHVETEKALTGKSDDIHHKHITVHTGIKDFDDVNTSGNVSVPLADIPVANFVHPYGSKPIPLRFARKEQKFKGDPIFNQSSVRPYIKRKLGGCESNLGMDDADMQLSTDFSDTSSRQRYGDRNNNNEFDVDSNEENDVESVVSDQQHRPFFPDMSSEQHWYQAQCFDHYWSHYRFVMQWYHVHIQAVKTLQTQMVGAWGYPQQQWGLLQSAWQSHRKNFGRNQQSKRSCHQRSAKRKSRRRSRRRSESVSHSAADKDGMTHVETTTHVPRHKKHIHTEADEEELEMEITDEMLEFFKTSFKHKIERAKTGEQGPISSAPTERPGVRRTEEMKELYGTGAPMIQAMETAMQLSFDRFLDRFQPSLWPNMPLKISFTK